MPGLQVTVRTSSFAFRGQESDVREIGTKSNVSHILEGSVRKAGNRIRVTGQLVKTADGYHLWSERWDRELADVSAIQDEISRAIVERLRLELAPELTFTKRYTENIDAYVLYLQARHSLYFFTPESPARRMECLQQAIATDPGYALAYAGMATAYFHLGFFGIVPPREAMAKSRVFVERAIARDPLSAFQHWRLGIRYIPTRQFDLALGALQQSAHLDPNYFAPRGHIGSLLLAQGRIPEGVAAMEESLAAYGVAGRAAAAGRLLTELQELGQSAYVPPTCLALIYVGLGETGSAFEWLERAVEARDPMMLHLKFIPQCDAIRSDPRYQALLRKMNLAA